MKLTSVLSVLFVAALSVTGDAKSVFPSYITQCSRKNIEPCVIKNVEATRPYLGKGIARLGLPAATPFIFPQIKVTHGNVYVESNNISTKNIADFQLKQFKLDLEKNTLVTEVHFPKLESEASFILKGNILGLDLNTNGRATGTLTNVQLISTFIGEQIMKNGKHHLNFTDKKVDVINLDDVSLYLYSLPEETNKFINENAKDFIKALGPVVDIYAGSMVEGAVKNLFEKIALEDLFTN